MEVLDRGPPEADRGNSLSTLKESRTETPLVQTRQVRGRAKRDHRIFLEGAANIMGDPSIRVRRGEEVIVDALAETEFGDVCARHRRLREDAEEETPDEHAGLLAHAPLRQRREQDAMAIEHLARVDHATSLREERGRERRDEERGELVERSGENLREERLAVRRELVAPEAEHDRIVHLTENLMTLRLVDEHRDGVEERCAANFHEREQDVPEHVLGAISPAVPEDLFHRRKKVRRVSVETRALSPTFADLVTKWMEVCVRPNNRASSRRSKRSGLNAHILPALGGLRLDEMSNEKIDTFKATLVAAGLKPKTVNNYLSMVRTALTTAKEWGLIREVPRFRWLAVPDMGYKYLSNVEVERLLAAAPPGLWRTLILFVVSTGARYSEAAALTWDDVSLDAERPVAHLWRSASREPEDRELGPTKTKRFRDVPLISPVVEALQALRHDRRFVFNPCEDRPLPHQTALKRIHEIAERAGLSTSWHPLRHTIATDLTAQGVSLRVVQELLGHTTIQMTTRYAHVAPSTLRESLGKLSYSDALSRAVGHQSGHQAHDLVENTARTAT